MQNRPACSLVTGGAGFMGSHVANELLKMGHEVVVLDDLSGGFVENVPSKALFVEGSITDTALLENLFSTHRFDYVFHLAAYAAEGLSHFIRRFNYTNNLIGSVNLINESVKHEIKCFVFTSSIAVYGSMHPPMREEMLPIPEDPYGVAKLAVEQDLHCSREMFGLNSIIFRPHNVYGEFQNLGDRYRNVVGIFMNQLMKEESLTIFGDGKQTRAFSYIGDVAPYIARSVENADAYNQTFNIGADEQYSVNELAEVVMQAMKSKRSIRYLPARLETVHAYADHAKMRRVFNIQSTTPLDVGISKMAEWAQQSGCRSSQKFKNIEISRNLPPIWLEESTLL